MANNDLIKDSIELIKTCARTFEPKITQIKKCIDSLIEEEYIKRSEGDVNKYEYIPWVKEDYNIIPNRYVVLFT